MVRVLACLLREGREMKVVKNEKNKNGENTLKKTTCDTTTMPTQSNVKWRLYGCDDAAAVVFKGGVLMQQLQCGFFVSLSDESVKQGIIVYAIHWQTVVSRAF